MRRFMASRLMAKPSNYDGFSQKLRLYSAQIHKNLRFSAETIH